MAGAVVIKCVCPPGWTGDVLIKVQHDENSSLFSRDWTLASRMLGRGGLWALFLSLLWNPACFMQRWHTGPKPVWNCSQLPAHPLCCFFLLSWKKVICEHSPSWWVQLQHGDGQARNTPHLWHCILQQIQLKIALTVFYSNLYRQMKCQLFV